MSGFSKAYDESILFLTEKVMEWSDKRPDDPNLKKMSECVQNIVFYVNDLEIREIKRKGLLSSLRKWTDN